MLTNVLLTTALVAFAPAPVGANDAPTAAVLVSPGQIASVTGICRENARPSDVSVTDHRGRQYRQFGNRWVNRHGITVARKHGNSVIVSRPAWIMAWCEQ